MSQDTGG